MESCCFFLNSRNIQKDSFKDSCGSQGSPKDYQAFFQKTGVILDADDDEGDKDEDGDVNDFLAAGKGLQVPCIQLLIHCPWLALLLMVTVAIAVVVGRKGQVGRESGRFVCLCGDGGGLVMGKRSRESEC